MTRSTSPTGGTTACAGCAWEGRSTRSPGPESPARSATAALRHEFAYDGAGRLSTITDGDGNVTTIERDGQGLPTTIVGPHGHITALEVDQNGYLSRINDPAGA